MAGDEWRVESGGHTSHLKLRQPSPQGTNPSWELTCGFAPSAPLHSAVPSDVNMGDNGGNRAESETKGAPVMAGGRLGGGWSDGSGLQGSGQHARVRNSMESAFHSHTEYCSVIIEKVI